MSYAPFWHLLMLAGVALAHVETIGRCSHGTSGTSSKITQQQLPDHLKPLEETRRMQAQADTFRNISILLNTTFIDHPSLDVSAEGGGNKSCFLAGQVLVVSSQTDLPNGMEDCVDSNGNVIYTDNCKFLCKQKDLVTTALSNSLKDKMQSIKEFFQSWLMVQDFSFYPNIFTDGACGDLRLSNQSVSDDIVIYLTLRSMPYLPDTLAFASPCFLHPISSRPIAIHVNVQPSTISANSDITTVLRHELVHGFGFSSDMYRFYRHPSDRTKTYYEKDQSAFPFGPIKSSNPLAITIDGYNGRVGPQINGTQLGAGRSIKLITPNVIAYGRQYFGCSTLDGVELENDGSSSSVATHWESRILYWETMTAIQKSVPGKFSGFTTALMKDMGFYDVQSSYSPDIMDFGYGKGCPFTDDRCNTTRTVSGVDVKSWYFCNNTSSDVCGYNAQYFGKCNLLDYQSDSIPVDYQYFLPEHPGRAGSDVFLNRCPMSIAITDGYCRSRQVSTGTVMNPFKETNGSSTRCHKSGVIDNQYVIQGGTTVVRCFKTICANKLRSMIRLGDYMFPCSAGSAVQFLGPAATDKTAPLKSTFIRSNDFKGVFTCSDPALMCDTSLAFLNSDMLQSSTWPSIGSMSPPNLTIDGGETVYLYGQNLSRCTGAELGEAAVTDFQSFNNSCVGFKSPPSDTVTGGPLANGAGEVFLKLRCKVTGCEEDDKGCFVAFAPTTLLTGTLAVYVPRKVLEKSSANVNIASTNAALTLSVGAVALPIAAVQQGVALSLVRMAQCDGDALDGSMLDPSVHPLRFGLGDGITKYARGAVLGNLLIIPCVWAVLWYLVVSYGVSAWRKQSLPTSREFIGWPGVTITPFSILSEGSAMACVALLFNASNSALDAAIGGVGLALLLASMVAWVRSLWLLSRLKSRSLECLPVPSQGILRLLKPRYEWELASRSKVDVDVDVLLPSKVAKQEADESDAIAASYLEGRLAFVGDSWWLWSQAAASALSVAVGVAEGLSLTDKSQCKTRWVITSAAAILQGIVILTNTILAEVALLGIICILTLGLIITISLSTFGVTEFSGGTFDALNALGIANSIVGVILMVLGVGVSVLGANTKANKKAVATSRQSTTVATFWGSTDDVQVDQELTQMPTLQIESDTEDVRREDSRTLPPTGEHGSSSNNYSDSLKLETSL